MQEYQTPAGNAFKALWGNPQLFGTTLLVMYLDLYGMEALEWDPATIQMEVEGDFNVDVPAGNYDRLLTAITILNSNTFYTSVPDFMRACVSLSGHFPPPNMMLMPSAAEVAWGITEAMFILPPEDDNENPLSPEITAFIGHVLDREGILNPPDVLRIATRDQNLVERVNFEYSDDPEMFGGITKMENSKTDDINHTIKGRLHALLMQLSSLPLRIGKTKAFVEKILQKLPQSDAPLPLPE